MAITWNVDLTIVQLSENVVSIKAVRTDDTPDPPDEWRYEVKNVNITTNGQTLGQIRDKVVDTIWDVYQRHLVRDAVIHEKKSAYEAAIASALQAKEET